jgi:hypothetical protein
MKKLCLLLSLLICLSFLIGNTTKAYGQNDSVIVSENHSGGLRFVYQTLPVDAKYKNETTTFYKDLKLKLTIKGDYECEFDTASMYGLEFFKITNNKITFGGLYMDSLTASADGNELRANAFLAGFGMGYTTNHNNPVRFEISPFGQIGMCRYVTTFDEETMDDEVSDWGLCWQGGIKGNLILVLNPIEIGINAGYIYYSQNFVRNDKTIDIEEVAKFDVTGSGVTYGATIGCRF